VEFHYTRHAHRLNINSNSIVRLSWMGSAISMRKNLWRSCRDRTTGQENRRVKFRG